MDTYHVHYFLSDNISGGHLSSGMNSFHFFQLAFMMNDCRHDLEMIRLFFIRTSEFFSGCSSHLISCCHGNYGAQLTQRKINDFRVGI